MSPDLTHKHRSMSPGIAMTRTCIRCGQHKPLVGGKVNKITRQWRCACCVNEQRKEQQ